MRALISILIIKEINYYHINQIIIIYKLNLLIILLIVIKLILSFIAIIEMAML